jgi:hypothetical protein
MLLLSAVGSLSELTSAQLHLNVQIADGERQQLDSKLQ